VPTQMELDAECSSREAPRTQTCRH